MTLMLQESYQRAVAIGVSLQLLHTDLKIGPKRDIIRGWEKAARNNGLPFAVSVHEAYAWSWYEPSQRADVKGPYKGVPYDGNLTIADDKGEWWEGLDPQELYAQNHPLSKNSEEDHMIQPMELGQWGNATFKRIYR